MSFPFLEIGRIVLETAPQVIWNPASGLRLIFYWAMTLFVYSQYHRTARLQGQLYGRPRLDSLRMTAIAALEGLVVGLIGSYLVAFVGVSFSSDGGGLIWVLGVALVLMFVNARFMCFSYAGGIVSLSYLILGFPVVSVPSLMALVAVLHLMESLLILVSGARGATPVYLEQGGRMVGGFHLQRSWPLPVALLILVVLSPAEAAGGIAMPGWWPLLRTSPDILAHPGATFFPLAIPAALGYGDLALTCPPRVKTRRTSLSLAAYSLVLLAMAVLSTYYRPLVWVTALFAPLAHEAVVRLGNSREMAGRPCFVPPEEGVMILDTVPDSLAARQRLGPGWVILDVNGVAITGRDQLELELEAAAQKGALRLTAVAPDQAWGRPDRAWGRPDRAWGWRRGGRSSPERRIRRISVSFRPGDTFGIIPVPEKGDDMGLTISRASPALAALGRLFRRVGRKQS